VPINRTWLGWLLVVFGAAIVYAALGPEDWQVRLGLHWLVEHFLAFFTLTVLACLIWPRPMLVAAVLVPVAVGLEVAQGLTPDRTPDVGTALMAAAAVALAALLVDLVLSLRQKRRKV
jgi:peptidoglycan/LPS O-acetylase OafA/YrhL